MNNILNKMVQVIRSNNHLPDKIIQWIVFVGYLVMIITVIAIKLNWKG